MQVYHYLTFWYLITCLGEIAKTHMSSVNTFEADALASKIAKQRGKSILFQPLMAGHAMWSLIGE